MPQQGKKSLVLSIYFILAVGTLLVFWQVRNFNFVNYDDDDYVYENSHVLNGLTADGAIWAFTTIHTGYWHPLTWFSYMLDRQLFGASAAGFHITNLVLHIANVLLLFFILSRMTNALWQSAFVAALFAIHPLHVESVAWVAERKDVLSTFFLLLTIWAYVRYAQQPRAARYLWVVVFFALGLMAKPMLVTLPFMLLLLDYWPLNRFGSKRSPAYLLIEKIPLFVMTVAVCAATFIAQKRTGAMAAVGYFSFPVRLANASVSYMLYIIKMISPASLAVFYPHPGRNVSIFYAVTSGIFLLVITILVIKFAKSRRYLFTGWFWFVGTLIPVIGIVQVGSQAYADRYIYIPYIGLFLIIAWLLPQFLSKWPPRKIILGLSMILVLAPLGICAHRQVSYWKNSITLFSHAIEVTQDNYVAYNNLGLAYNELGRYAEAIEASKQSIKIKPNYALAYYTLGVTYGRLGRDTDAIEAYQQAIKIKPDYALAHYALGVTYARLGRYAEAIESSKQAIRIKPDFADAYKNLGNASCALGRFSDAIESYKQAIRIKPDDPGAYYNLGNACYALGRYPDAIDAFQQAVKIKPDYAEAHYNLGIAYDALGRFSDAIDEYKLAVRINPADPDAHFRLGADYLATGDKNSALAEYNILKSSGSELANNLLKEINK
jgi:protein O-mannosyl-transferase